MQEDQQRGRRIGVAQPLVFDADVAASRSRSLKRWILPVAVLGNSGRNSIWRGYLYGARRSFTKACNSALLACAPSLSTTKALVRVSPASSGTPITAASSTAGCCTSVASTSKGET